MSTFRNYDPERIVVTFRGVLVAGFASGSFVTIERTEDAFALTVGAQGDVTRVRSRNRSGSVTLALQAAAPANDSLSAIAAQDEAFGTGYGPLMIKDLNGTTLAQAAVAWVRKLPAVEFAAEASDRSWVLDCAELELAVGGAVA